jgi:hypothetical protein
LAAVERQAAIGPAASVLPASQPAMTEAAG